MLTEDGPQVQVETVVLASLFKDVEGPRPQLDASNVGRIAEERNPKAFRFDEYFVEGERDHYYAVARGTTEDGNCFTVAKKLTVNGSRIGLLKAGAPGDVTLAAEPDHSCTGNGCSHCLFDRNSQGEIIGCLCDEDRNQAPAGGWCDHSMSGGS